MNQPKYNSAERIAMKNEIFETFVGGALWATLVIAVATLPQWMQWCIDVGMAP